MFIAGNIRVVYLTKCKRSASNKLTLNTDSTKHAGSRSLRGSSWLLLLVLMYSRAVIGLVRAAMSPPVSRFRIKGKREKRLSRRHVGMGTQWFGIENDAAALTRLHIVNSTVRRSLRAPRKVRSCEVPLTSSCFCLVATGQQCNLR